MSGNAEQQGLEGIAVVGMAGRFPGAGDVDAYWRNLCAGVESIRFYSEDELREAGVSPELLADPAYVRANAALDGVELFDAAFFGMNPGVAQITDPQQRVFLETAWHALEHAGYDAERFEGDIGVFGGLSINTYLLENLATNRQLIESHGLLQAAIANRGDHLATLTAYKLNLRGPAFTVQSTCSTALSAVHLACQALLSYQTDMALAGGVSVRVPQTMGYLFQEGGVASPDGHCRPFDAKAKGTVFGSGAGVVVLKRLEDALAAGDTIHAVIRGSAANNDGTAKIGYTAPSSEGQRRAISMALAVAGVHPDTVGYVECHGTGTVLGDPIEIEALTHAFGAKTQRRQYCALGSVKSNIGHLDTAAGIAGLIKTVLCLEHKQLPPTLHFESPNPAIDFARSPFYVNAKLTEWPRPEKHPRRAGVSSFGIGGTNVHMVLEEAPPVASRRAADGWHTLVLSARTASALETKTDQLRQYLAAHPELDIGDVAYTLQLGRKPFEFRRALTCRSLADAVDVLERLPTDRAFTGRVEGNARAVAFLFPGLGSQHPGMSRELYDAQPVFREHLDTCLARLEAELGMDPRPVLFPRFGNEAEAAQALTRTHLAEPVLFAVEVALARTWMAWGVRPRAVLGEGIGEYAAACVAGVVSLEDAVAMVALRSRLVKRLPEGAMTLVMLPEAEVAGLLSAHGLSLAWVGRPSVCAVSGPRPGIEALEAELRRRGATFRRLAGDRALQSPDVDGITAELAAALRRVSFRAPEVPLFSGVTAAWASGPELAEPSWWASQLRRTLRLSPGLEALFQEPDRLLVEVGPGRTWLNIARLHPAKSPRQVVLGSLVQDTKEPSEPRALMAALARLWMHGGEVDWAGHHAGASRRRIPLPQYPFERQRLWLEPTRQAPATPQPKEDTLPPRRVDLADWFFVPSWKRTAPPTAPARDAEGVLLFTDAFGLGELLATRLEQRGHTVLRVERGTHGGAPAEGRYVVDPRRPGDYRQLLQDLKGQGKLPGRIIHMWSVDPQRAAGSRLEALPRVEESGFRSLMYLAQALGAVQATTPVELQVLTSQVFQVTGDETLCPEKATLLGPCLVIGQEYPNVKCRLIDVPLPTPGSAEEGRLVGHLLAEVESGARDTVTAWRGRHRWTRTHEPVRLEAREGRSPRLRPGGVYLITGGLGGIGLVLAEDVARQAGGARLVLLGRKALPERSRWSALLASEGDSPTARALRRIRELERHGAEVMTVAADVTDRARMAEVLADVRARFGAVHGVIHAAGVPAGGALQLKTDEVARRVLAPKVRGTLVLDELLEGQPLDFVVYCASRTSVLGGFGQADYVAANAFQDAWAHHKARTSSTFTVAIDWCSWREVGMLASAAARAAPRAAEAPPAPAPVTGEPVALGHPLLAKRMPSAPGHEVYETVLRVETHWVLDDHRILGNPVIAGTTYLEMVRAAFAERMRQRQQDLEISDVYFLTPLSVRLGDQRVALLELTDEGAEGWSFQVSSLGTEGTGLIRHVMGRARLVPTAPERRHDLAALTAACAKVKEFTDEDSHDEDHGPRWQCVRRVRWGEQQVLATLELPAEFASDLEVMKLHPSMLDKSIGTGRDFILGAVPYMPYSYKRLVVRHPFTRRIHVHTRSRGEASNRGETPSFDIRILDDTGRELVEITEFSLKRVNDVGAMYKNLASRDAAPATAPAPSAPKAPAPAATTGENVFQQILRQEAISPEEGVELFRRVLASADMPQLVVSTRDLEALLARGLVHTAPTKVAEEEVAVEAESDTAPQRATRPRPELPVPYQAPQTPMQEKLGEILREVLGLERVGLHDNFFDLGGDSVMAIQIVSRIKRKLGKEIAVVQLFEAPTLGALATLLGGSAGGEDAPAGESSVAAEPAEDSASRGARRRAKAIARRGGEGA
jgi:acyl transferase domain-containing protein/acyl carrier protein